MVSRLEKSIIAIACLFELVNFEAGFFRYFASGAGQHIFSMLQMSTRQLPAIGCSRIDPLTEQEPALVPDQHGNTDIRSLRA